MEVDYIYIAGEELADTAKREVFEETGVEENRGKNDL
jgi:ADP-ribose pyrophosphatase YjhB (NUDIX family)